MTFISIFLNKLHLKNLRIPKESDEITQLGVLVYLSCFKRINVSMLTNDMND